MAYLQSVACCSRWLIPTMTVLIAGVTGNYLLSRADSKVSAGEAPSSNSGNAKSNADDNRDRHLISSKRPASDSGARQEPLKPINIDSLEQLERIAASVLRQAGKTEERTQGKYHEISGLFSFEGRVPGRGLKAPNRLDCGWHEFILDRTWPHEVFHVGEVQPHVRVVAKLFWRDPFVFRTSVDDIRLPSTHDYADGERVEGKYQLRPQRIWVEVKFPNN
jgi:hypothetical protein